ncbi:flippase [Oceanobacillus arenosus]|uniref:Flippase n=1 Tax=Oceanobacillus arenosus TaxID=1229153 RepID=A0A3D8Q0V4_9BACI|nr:lipopolysaccharide biosynthesis protein [Oceanobacillus arenosus]RDW21447.1 flippase [Oceanobacillus arenosus]
MGHEVTKKDVITSLLWKLLERGGTQGIQFIVTIVLARILLPEEFGLIVLVTIFISIAGIFVQSGFNMALIQKKDADEVDFSSVFYLSLLVAGILYIILFFTAPFIASFFGETELTSVLRVLSIILFFGAFNSIQIAVISRNMQFKKLFTSSLGAVIISAIVGIGMAYNNYGVWALVGQQLSNQLSIMVILWFTVNWRPKLTFSIERVKSLFSFGWKLLVSNLIDILYKNLQSLFVGRMYDSATLGFYNRGEQFPKLIVSNIDGSIQSVMLPTLSSYQDNKKKFKVIVRRSVVTSSFIVFPMMVGMAIAAEPLIKIVLTDKWLPAVPFLQIFCVSFALWPIHTANLQAVNALGRSDVFLKLEIIKKIVGLIILGISIPFGVYAIAIGVLITSIISTFINAFPNSKIINYSIPEQFKDIVPSLILSLVMGILVYIIKFFELGTLLTLLLQIFFGVIIYIGLAKLFRLECYNYLISTAKEILKRKN